LASGAHLAKEAGQNVRKPMGHQVICHPDFHLQKSERPPALLCLHRHQFCHRKLGLGNDFFIKSHPLWAKSLAKCIKYPLDLDRMEFERDCKNKKRAGFLQPVPSL
jgi:hypothetical protein